MKKKAWLSALAVVLVLCCAVGGTLAWLTQKTDAVVNTFTVGDINITLTETEREYKMVPGNTIDKESHRHGTGGLRGLLAVCEGGKIREL